MSSKIPLVAIAVAAGVLILALLLYHGFYRVSPEEVGVVMRFGAYNRTTAPGLHFKIPLSEEVIKVPVQRQLRQEFGFRSRPSGDRAGSSPLDIQLDIQQERTMLTGDLDIAVVEWIVDYRIANPRLYLFRVRNVEETFRDMSEALMRQVVGERTVGEILVGEMRAGEALAGAGAEVEAAFEIALQELVDQFRLGIVVDQVVLQRVELPDPVKPSWEEVEEAEALRDQIIGGAQAGNAPVRPGAGAGAEAGQRGRMESGR